MSWDFGHVTCMNESAKEIAIYKFTNVTATKWPNRKIQSEHEYLLTYLKVVCNKLCNHNKQ